MSASWRGRYKMLMNTQRSRNYKPGWLIHQFK